MSYKRHVWASRFLLFFIVKLLVSDSPSDALSSACDEANFVFEELHREVGPFRFDGSEVFEKNFRNLRSREKAAEAEAACTFQKYKKSICTHFVLAPKFRSSFSFT